MQTNSTIDTVNSYEIDFYTCIQIRYLYPNQPKFSSFSKNFQIVHSVGPNDGTTYQLTFKTAQEAHCSKFNAIIAIQLQSYVI